MAWPTPQDYNEAVQSPHICFMDDGLRAGRIELDTLGLPRPITGAFASVYRVTSGDEDWAVRCFLRYTADLHLRYSALSEFVVNDNLEFTAPFHYLPQGILVNGSWRPILKMQWVKGETLDSYVRKYCYEPEKILWLATAFAKMIAEMNNAGIAHGDLQHGNILVHDRSLMLVDYDGMFFPKLLGWSSNELGHRNYQHPSRTEHDFGHSLDDFSANLIYWSLRIIATYPFPDDLLNYESEGLIFSREDFIAPERSPAFCFLEHHEIQEISGAAKYLRSLLSFKCMEVPRLITALAEQNQPSDLPALTRDQFVNRGSFQHNSFPANIEPGSSTIRSEETPAEAEHQSPEGSRAPAYSQLTLDYKAEFGVPYLAKKWAELSGNPLNQAKVETLQYTRRKYDAAGQGIVNSNIYKVRFYVIDRSAVGRSLSIVISEGLPGRRIESMTINNWNELTLQERNSVLLNTRKPIAGRLYMSIAPSFWPSEPVVVVMESGLPLWVFNCNLRDLLG